MQVRHVMKLAGVDAKGALKIMNDPAKMIDLMGQHLADIQLIIGLTILSIWQKHGMLVQKTSMLVKEELLVADLKISRLK